MRGYCSINGGVVMRGIMILVIAAALLPSVAHGDPTREQARKAYDEAKTHYDLSEYDQALVKFKDAFRLLPDPAFLFNIAQCQRQLGDYQAAQRSYRAFLREAKVSDAQRADVEQLIASMELAMKEKRAQQPPTGTRAPQEAPPPTTATPPSTPPTQANQPSAVIVSTSLPQKEQPRPVYKRGWFWGVIGGVVVVAVVVGVTVGVTSSGTTYPQLPNPTVGTVHF